MQRMSWTLRYMEFTNIICMQNLLWMKNKKEGKPFFLLYIKKLKWKVEKYDNSPHLIQIWINLCPGPKTLSWSISTFLFRGSRWRVGNLATIAEKKLHPLMPSITEVGRQYIIRVGWKTCVTFVATWYVKFANLLCRITQKDAMWLNPNGLVVRVWRYSLRKFQQTHHMPCDGGMCTVKTGSQKNKKRGNPFFVKTGRITYIC